VDKVRSDNVAVFPSDKTVPLNKIKLVAMTPQPTRAASRERKIP
jgi:hypothetical protein